MISSLKPCGVCTRLSLARSRTAVTTAASSTRTIVSPAGKHGHDGRALSQRLQHPVDDRGRATSARAASWMRTFSAPAGPALTPIARRFLAGLAAGEDLFHLGETAGGNRFLGLGQVGGRADQDDRRRCRDAPGSVPGISRAANGRRS